MWQRVFTVVSQGSPRGLPGGLPGGCIVMPFKLKNWLLRVDRGKLFLFMNCNFLVELSSLIADR